MRSVAHRSVANKPLQAVEHLLAKHRPLSLTFARLTEPDKSTAWEEVAEKVAEEVAGTGREVKQQQTVRPANWDAAAAAEDFQMAALLEQIVEQVEGARYVSHDPPIVVIDEFLTDDECASVIKIGTPGLEPSTGTGQYKNGKFERIKMASRTSHNSWLMNGLVSTGLFADPSLPSTVGSLFTLGVSLTRIMPPALLRCGTPSAANCVRSTTRPSPLLTGGAPM